MQMEEGGKYIQLLHSFCISIFILLSQKKDTSLKLQDVVLTFNGDSQVYGDISI